MLASPRSPMLPVACRTRRRGATPSGREGSAARPRHRPMIAARSRVDRPIADGHRQAACRLDAWPRCVRPRRSRTARPLRAVPPRSTGVETRRRGRPRGSAAMRGRAVRLARGHARQVVRPVGVASDVDAGRLERKPRHADVADQRARSERDIERFGNREGFVRRVYGRHPNAAEVGRKRQEVV